MQQDQHSPTTQKEGSTIKKVIVIVLAAIVGISAITGAALFIGNNVKYSCNFYNTAGLSFHMDLSELIDYEALYFNHRYDGETIIQENWIRHSFSNLEHMYFFADGQIAAATFRDVPIDPRLLYGEPDETPSEHTLRWYGTADGVKLRIDLSVDYMGRPDTLYLVRE